MTNSIGSILRQWRKQRRYSQLQLAVELDVSSKHISFLETGRSKPSREMLLKIGTFLYLPKREVNRALYVAGFAPFYTELPDTHENLAPVFSAIDQMIVNHMPYPAIVLNQNWDIVKANDSAKSLLTQIGFANYSNLIEALISDKGKTSKIINWHEAVSVVLIRLRYEISMLGGSPRLEELEEQLSLCLSSDEEQFSLKVDQAVLSTQFQLPDQVLSFFSMIAQLGTVQDVTVSEFKVELMFPADEVTKDYYRLA